jgi:para-aminobenzoate synthetase/4-amino-4-deoxychorismate lyase
MIQAQPVDYPAYVDTGRHVLCSASPELFFRLDGNFITCRPMKGTVKRGRTLAEDEAQAKWLHASEKNRAENVMIVDMIRNDLGRVAEIGSVRVPELFTTERYRTLWQMTSTVTAKTRASFAELMTALFPCASITGAPKVSTVNIIAHLETTPRGVYTGCIGMLAPGRKAQFNVAIRTVTVDRQRSEAEYGVGGGIVWDSTAEGEYDEALLKARIITQKHPAFDLFETLRWTPTEGYFLLERHLSRLGDSAAYFGFPFDRGKTSSHLADLAGSFPPTPLRVRLLLKPDGSLNYQTAPLPGTPSLPLRVKLASAPLNSDDIFLFHKTTHRDVYEKARAACPDCDDMLLHNERDELTEFTIGNLVAEINGELVTPPVECGLLAGTFRAHLLAQGEIREKVITREELPSFKQIFLVNSVRGWQKVELSG